LEVGKLKVKGWIAALVLGGLLLGCQQEPLGTTDLKTRVGTVIARIETLEMKKSYAGVVGFARETLLSFRLSGEIETFFFDENESVEAGELLVRLDPLGYESQVEGARRDYDSALNQVNQAQDQRDFLLNRYEDFSALYETGSVSKSALDEVRLQYESAVETYASALSQMNKARTYYEEIAGAEGNFELVAPREGMLARRFFEPGEVVPAGTPVVAFAEAGTHVMIHVSSEELHEFEVDDPVKIHYREAVIGGRVMEIGKSPDPMTLEYELSILVEARIPMGQVVRVEKIHETHTGVVLPIYAILGEEEGFYVLTVDEEDRAHERAVEVLSLVDDRVVVSGIEAGERVVLEGNHLVKDEEIVVYEERDVAP